MRLYYSAEFISKNVQIVVEFLFKGGEIPQAIKQKESSGRINLGDVDSIRFHP